MNTNDFSVCKVGDKLYSLQIGWCDVREHSDGRIWCATSGSGSGILYSYQYNGKRNETDEHQSIYFSIPKIIAPAKKEPLRLECECEWLKNINGDVYPLHEYSDMLKFVGKRTKMILEEII